jgi:sirohydrochlorin ferrochelatase
MVTALLLIAHGSRNKEANDDLLFVAEDLRRCGLYPIVEASYLELAAPDIFGGARKCLDEGARRVILLPYFLSAGIHVRRDLSAFREQLASQYPGAEFLLAEPLGRHETLIQLVLLRAQEAEK